MKQVTEYLCEICGTKYSTETECRACEESHRIPQEITNWTYEPYKENTAGYPEKIIVLFDNGSYIGYKRI